jgi:N-acetylmuramoyl-L-alanine amidase
VSIHANSCPDYCDARGASVWVLSTHGKQSEAGKWLAKSENASDLIGGVSLDDKSHMLASVLLDLSQGASMHAAGEVGGDVLAALGKIGPLYRDTVQGANFVVLRSPDVPSILVETAFISNRVDEGRLDNSKDRQRLAQGILTGVRQYFQTTPPPGTWFAMERNKRLHLTADAAPEIATAADTARGAAIVSADAPQLAAVGKAPDSDDPFQDMHKVSRGETLSGIARQYGISTSSLRSVNSSKIQAGGGIQVGQVLLIPNS